METGSLLKAISHTVKRAEYSEDYAVFRQYMDMVLRMQELCPLMELDKVNIEDMKIGDIFMKVLPVIVSLCDMAENKSTEKSRL